MSLGLWIDEPTAPERLAGLAREDDQLASQLESLRTNGYTIIENAVDHAAIDAYLKDFNRSVGGDEGVIVSQGREIRPLQDSDLRTPIVKILDTYARLPSARELAFAPTITRFMTALFEEKPLAFQSLHFEVGSTQAVHQDTAYVVLDTPKKLAAVWIALEDIEEGSGELIYYPGSHRFGEFMYPGDRKHWVAEEDGHPIHNHHLNWLHEEAKRRGVAQQAFRPRKGDALVWHADLAHGGGEIRDRTKTRRSLVVHYAPGSATPHYFKFVDQRRQTKVPHRDAGFLSSFFYDL